MMDRSTSVFDSDFYPLWDGKMTINFGAEK